MSVTRFLRRAVRAILPPALFLGLTAYFGWNALQGAHGMRAYHQQLKLREDALQAQRDANAEQGVWKQRIISLDERALDADMLDERSRAMLNLAREGDIVIPYAPNDKLW
ncbi:FtsB family cell division protein [Acidomonas methanolica]|uniref:FtsB family cell division protein n=1 Tax=Acidomonas methanolica TaxID=437 RepID=UPI002119FF03|nr:septum formation initiator family protein [Acidomonas methanolica]